MIPITTRNRRLKNESDIFTQNAWDDTEWSAEMLEEAQKRVSAQKDESGKLEIDINQVEPKVNERWEEFYKTHGDKFFKDRKWIFSEFPEIIAHLNEDSPPCKLLEVGCGVGNAVSHIAQSNSNPSLHIYCCDLSSSAIEILKKRDFYEKRKLKIDAFQADICRDFKHVICSNIGLESLDFITIIFTLSALKPDLIQSTVNNLATLLKPGGIILFRDYAQYDLTQLRFKGKSYLGENYYVRADGTTSYFFTKEWVEDVFKTANLIQIELKQDNRILVNRLKSLKMTRCWIQGKFKKSTGV